VDPIRKSVTVETDPEKAFAAFTGRMGSWWNPDHHIAPNPFVDAVVEPAVGGRWYEVDAEGNETAWGKVLAWEPPARLVLAWQLTGDYAYDPDFLTEVEVRFTDQGGRTLVEVEHRDMDRFGDQAEQIHAQFDHPDGWQGLLDRFAGAI
jgi:uncharacterized protein YndB with AHSA1/START domain